jgi:hypothetical protein
MPTRKAQRLSRFDYDAPGAYFVTICVAGKECVLGTVEGGRVLLNTLGAVVARGLADVPTRRAAHVDSSVVMPNHVHAVIWLRGNGLRWVRSSAPSKRRVLVKSIVFVALLGSRSGSAGTSITSSVMTTISSAFASTSRRTRFGGRRGKPESPAFGGRGRVTTRPYVDGRSGDFRRPPRGSPRPRAAGIS